MKDDLVAFPKTIGLGQVFQSDVVYAPAVAGGPGRELAFLKMLDELPQIGFFRFRVVWGENMAIYY